MPVKSPADPSVMSASGQRIDVHHHYVPPVYVSEINPKSTLPPPVRFWTLEKTLADMETGGTTTSILSVTTPGLWFGDKTASAKLARACNDYAAKMVSDAPKGRFGMWVALPLPDVDATLKEIEYGMDTLKADGVGFFTSYDNKYLGDPSYAPILQELNRRKAVLYTHPNSCTFCSQLVPNINEATLEYGFDTTRTIASIIFNGAAAKYPDIKFIFSHAGGTMPFLVQRFQNQGLEPQVKANIPRGVMYELQRFYYDTAQAYNPVAMQALAKVVPMSQVVFGTDFPFRRAVDHVNGLKTCGFTDADLMAIDSGNALRLLPKFKKA